MLYSAYLDNMQPYLCAISTEDTLKQRSAALTNEANEANFSKPLQIHILQLAKISDSETKRKQTLFHKEINVFSTVSKGLLHSCREDRIWRFPLGLKKQKPAIVMNTARETGVQM